MGAGIRKQPRPTSDVAPNRIIESNIIEISADDDEFYHKSSPVNDQIQQQLQHHHHHQAQNEISKNDLQLIDFQDQEVLSKKESYDRQNSVRSAGVTATAGSNHPPKDSEKKRNFCDKKIEADIDPAIVDHRIHPSMEEVTEVVPSPERKQSRHKILDSLVMTSVDDLHCRSGDSNDSMDHGQREEIRRKSASSSRPSSTKKPSCSLTPPRSGSSKKRHVSHKGSDDTSQPSQKSHPVEISLPPSPVTSARPASHPKPDSPPRLALSPQEHPSVRVRKDSFLTSPRDEVPLKSRQNSAENSTRKDRNSGGDPSPLTPFYQKSKHEAVFHQLQINELRNSLDDNHVKSLIEQGNVSSPQLITSLSSTSDVSGVSPSLRSDLDDDEAAALIGQGKLHQKVKKENKLLLELQRQRTMSTMHNAKLELEVDSLRRQLEYLDQLEQEEEQQRFIEQEAKVSSRHGWRPAEESEDHQGSGGGAQRQQLRQQMKPQLPPGIQIGSHGSKKSMSPCVSNGGLATAQQQHAGHVVSLQMLSPRSLKKNNSVVALSPRGSHSNDQPQPKPTRLQAHRGYGNGHQHSHASSSPPPVSPRLARKPSESINVSPIRRVNQGTEVGSKATGNSQQLQAQPQEMNVVGRAHQLSDAKPSQRRKHQASSSTRQHDSLPRSDSENETKQQELQKQTSRSVLKNVNRRLRQPDSAQTETDEEGSQPLEPPPIAVLSAHESKISGAVGKRKHLLSKVNEKKGTEGGSDAEDSQSQGPGSLSSVEATQAKETNASGARGKVIARKPKERRSQPARGAAAQRKSMREQHADLMEESVDEQSSNPPARGSSIDWSATMDMRRNEVEFLLRRPLNSDADIQFALASAEAGLIFMDELNRVAKSLNMLRGTLSRWLLPYDNNTSISDQCSNFSSVVDHMPEDLRGKLTEKQVNYLVSGVNGVRQLIRVKIADDNDLELARDSLQTAADFLKRLTTEAEKYGDSPFELFRSRH